MVHRIFDAVGPIIGAVVDPGGPIELDGLADSFAALARFYRRHYRPHPEQEFAPKLFISKLENGSVIAEIVPLIMLLGMAVPYMDTALIVSEFTKRTTWPEILTPHGWERVYERAESARAERAQPAAGAA